MFGDGGRERGNSSFQAIQGAVIATTLSLKLPGGQAFHGQELIPFLSSITLSYVNQFYYHLLHSQSLFVFYLFCVLCVTSSVIWEGEREISSVYLFCFIFI